MSKRQTANVEYDESDEILGAQGKQGEEKETKHGELRRPILTEVIGRTGEE